MAGETPIPDHEAFKERVDPELSRSLDDAAKFVTNNIDLVINGERIDHPFEGTYTMSAVVVGAKEAEREANNPSPELLAAASAKQTSEHLEETMGYGDLSPIALKKAKQLVEIADQVPSDRLRSSDPDTTKAIVNAGNEHTWVGAARADQNPSEPGAQKFVVGTSGGEGTRKLIQAMFPNESFDFDADPTQLERGAGLLDEIVSRLTGGVMILKALGVNFGDEHITLELTELQPDRIKATEESLRDVPGNQTDDGEPIVHID